MSSSKCLDLFSNNIKEDCISKELLDKLYYESWRFTVETNGVCNRHLVPKRCVVFVEESMTCGQYLSDLEAVSSNSLQFAKSVEIGTNNGKDVWVFDIDETLLSMAPFFASRCWGSEPYEKETLIEWQEEAL